MIESLRLLMVEDQEELRELIGEALRDAGITVDTADDGHGALRMLRESGPYDVVFSDIRMPRINGYQLVEQGLALRPNLKVLLMTGYTQDPVPEHLTSRGVVIIYKPFDEDRFVAMARGMIATG